MNIAWPAAEIRWKWLRPGATANELPPASVASWLNAGPATAVKNGAHRVVYRVDLAHGPVYLKHYRCLRLGDVLRQVVRPSASQRESRRALELARRGIPSAAPLAVGEIRRGGLVGDNFLVTLGIADSCPLDEFVRTRLAAWPSQHRDRWRRRLIRSVARFCAKLHQAGAEHDDLHLGNLLVRLDADGLPRCTSAGEIDVHLIDVPGVRFSRPLPWRRSRLNLAMLCGSATTCAGSADLARFWIDYLRARSDLAISDRAEAAGELSRSIVAAMRDKQRSRDRRVWGNNRDYYRLVQTSGSACAIAELSRPALAELLADARGFVSRWLSRPIKLGHRSIVVQGELQLGDERVDVAVKRWREPAWRRRLRGRWSSRAARQWHRANALLARDIATPQPLACLELPRAAGAAESVLIARWEHDAVDLHRRAWDLAGLPAKTRRQAADRAAVALGQLVGRLHFWRIAHRDLKWGNLLITADEAPRALVTDLDGLRLPGRWRMAGLLPHRTRVRNLARLAASLALHPWVSRTTCLRFLRSYLEHEPSRGSDDWKRLACDVTTAAERYVAVARRQQRPLG